MADSCLFLLVLILGLLWLVWLWRSFQPPQSQPAATRTTLQRLLKPRTPDDCPACRQEKASPARREANSSARSFPGPRSRAVAVLRSTSTPRATLATTPPVSTSASPTRRSTRSSAMAVHGKCERIQTFRCQACGHTFSSRRHTPLYRLKTASSRVAEVLAALAEGLDVSAAVRVFGHSEATITRWLRRAGDHGETLHQRCFQNLHLPHVQLDEIRTRLRSRDQVLWLWLAFDPVTQADPRAPPGATHSRCCPLRHPRAAQTPDARTVCPSSPATV